MTRTEAINRYESNIRSLVDQKLSFVYLEEIKDIDDYLRSHQMVMVKNSNPKWNNYYLYMKKELVKQFQACRLLFLIKQKLVRPFEFLKYRK